MTQSKDERIKELEDKLQLINDTLGEAIHTMFRKGIDDPDSNALWEGIRDLDGDSWDEGLGWLRYGWGLPSVSGD